MGKSCQKIQKTPLKKKIPQSQKKNPQIKKKIKICQKTPQKKISQKIKKKIKKIILQKMEIKSKIMES